jgi:polyhydroxyalkanoate synthase subunit PhaC
MAAAVETDPPHPSEALLEATRRLTRLGLRGATGGCAGQAPGLRINDPLRLGQAVIRLSSALLANPERLVELQTRLWLDYLALGQRSVQRWFGLDPEPTVVPERGDRRFHHPGWDEHALFDWIKQAYLLTGNAVVDLVAGADALDEATRRRLHFATRHIVDALSPSNFAATNPEVLDAIVRTGGSNLVFGLANLLEDLERSQGRFDIRMTDFEAFEVGENLAVTPGKVVYQNDLMQLIQYAPTTEKVARRPLLMLPPWMNKYYILDLRPGNSMVQWLVDQGHTVFMVSWVNPDEALAGKGFDDYMAEGPLAALDAIERATGEREVNAVGYCLGGILLSATLAWMAARGDERVHSATLLTTMVDFSDAGEVSVFIDEHGLDELEAQIRERGYLDGLSMFDTTRALRANDLVWSFFVRSYLLGEAPRPFDLLYWNADATHMPAAVHAFVLRELYLENRLREPGGLTLAGEAIDVRRIQTPTYVLAAREDHIAPWRTAYQATQLFGGPLRFVLGASGHIAGVVNPPHRDKYGYWTGSELTPDADGWLAGAKQHAGSWWPDWARWVRRHAGGQVPARAPGTGALPALEDAPGSYVRRRII